MQAIADRLARAEAKFNPPVPSRSIVEVLDARLLLALTAIGGRTKTCPCGYTFRDSCPVHD